MSLYKKLFSYAKEKTAFIILSMVLSGIATVISFIPYYYFWRLLTEITTSCNRNEIERISYIIFIITGIYLLTYFLALACSHLFAFRLETNMKKRGLENLLTASFSFFDINPSGKTRKIIDDNSGNTHTAVAHILPDLVNAVLFPVCLLVLAFYVNVYIGLIITGAVVFAMICFKFMYSDPNMMQDYMEALEDINSETVEYVRGIQVIKIFDTVIESFDKLYKAIVHYAEVVNRQCRNCKIPYVAFQSGMLSFGALIVIVGKSMWDGGSPMGEVLSLVVFFVSFSGLLFGAFAKIMFFSKNYQLAMDAMDKLEDIMEKMNGNKLNHGKINFIKNCDIEFKNVSFQYEEGVPVLENFSIKLEGNKKYALVGSSGGGKSTIAKLISGFYPISQGEILIGGKNIEEYSSKALEENIAFVFQNAKLFKTSIYENVRIGNPKAAHEDIMKALELAMCNDILDKFDTREETIIGAKGVHLSGGEMQRIAIARAILKDAPIIILDEASAASDPENEYEMQKAFTSLMKGKTVIMIAHRLSSIRNVDQVLVVDDGKLIEQGTHDELMEKESQYKMFQNLFNKANDWRV